MEVNDFLKDINNEGSTRNELYGKNMAMLERFVMYMFEKDTVVVPKESAVSCSDSYVVF